MSYNSRGLSPNPMVPTLQVGKNGHNYRGYPLTDKSAPGPLLTIRCGGTKRPSSSMSDSIKLTRISNLDEFDRSINTIKLSRKKLGV